MHRIITCMIASVTLSVTLHAMPQENGKRALTSRNIENAIKDNDWETILDFAQRVPVDKWPYARMVDLRPCTALQSAASETVIPEEIVKILVLWCQHKCTIICVHKHNSTRYEYTDQWCNPFGTDRGKKRSYTIPNAKWS